MRFDPARIKQIMDEETGKAPRSFDPAPPQTTPNANTQPNPTRDIAAMPGRFDPARIKRIMDEVAPPEPERTVLGTVKDVGVSALKGAVALPEAVQGIADIATGGKVGKFTESLGYKPRETQEILDRQFSPAQQAANKRVDEAEGFTGTLKAMVDNPSTIAHSVVESLPLMVGGQGIARMGMKAAPKFFAGNTTRQLAASAAGEGAISAGATAESIRSQTEDGLLTPEQSAMATASGLGTGAFTMAGGRLAQKLGFGDVDSMLAGISTGEAKKDVKSVIKNIVGGGISEGAFEELPQSVQETIWENAALDKPLLEGTGEAAAQGLLTGAAMGSGANVLSTARPSGPVTKALDKVPNMGEDVPSFSEGGTNDTVQSAGNTMAQARPEENGNAQTGGVVQNQNTQQLGKEEAQGSDRNIPVGAEIQTTMGEEASQASVPGAGSGRDVTQRTAKMESDLAEAEINDLLSDMTDEQIAMQEQDYARTRRQNFLKLRKKYDEDNKARLEENKRQWEAGNVTDEEAKAFEDKVKKERAEWIRQNRASGLRKRMEQLAKKNREDIEAADKELENIDFEFLRQAEKEAEQVVREDPRYAQMNEAHKRGGLNIFQARAAFSHETIATLNKKYPGLFQGGHLAATGQALNVDEFAGELGYDSADQMVNEWLAAPTIKAETAKIVKQKQAEWDYYDNLQRQAEQQDPWDAAIAQQGESNADTRETTPESAAAAGRVVEGQGSEGRDVRGDAVSPVEGEAQGRAEVAEGERLSQRDEGAERAGVDGRDEGGILQGGVLSDEAVQRGNAEGVQRDNAVDGNTGIDSLTEPEADTQSEIPESAIESAAKPAGAARVKNGFGIYEIKDNDGVLQFYPANSDFPNESRKPTRGELYWSESKNKRKGAATAKAKKALKVMQSLGVETVNMNGVTKEGRAFIEGMQRQGLIAKTPIKESETGKKEYEITLGSEQVDSSVNWVRPTRKQLKEEWQTETLDTMFFTGYPKKAQPMRDEQANQVVNNAIEMIDEAGSPAAALEEFELPAGYEAAYQAAIEVAQAPGTTPQAQSKPAKKQDKAEPDISGENVESGMASTVTDEPYDSETFYREREKKVEASRKSGKKHADSLDFSVEGLRGVRIKNVVSGEVGVITSANSNGTVNIIWEEYPSLDSMEGEHLSMPREDLREHVVVDKPGVKLNRKTGEYSINKGKKKQPSGKLATPKESQYDWKKEPWQMERTVWNSGEWRKLNKVETLSLTDIKDANSTLLETGQLEGKTAYRTQKVVEGKRVPAGEWSVPVKDRPDDELLTKAQHKKVVSKALSEGKQVPPEVLADYPDLQAQPTTKGQDKANVEQDGEAKEEAVFSKSPKSAITKENLNDFVTNENNREYTTELERVLGEMGSPQTVTPASVPKRLFALNRKGRKDNSGPPKSDFQLAERIAASFGKAVVWAKVGENYTGFNGAVIRDGVASGKVFIDVRSPLPAHVILGHELSHYMETEVPQVYKDLYDAVAPLLKNQDKYRDSLSLQGDDTFISQEIIGDLLGNAFNDPSFWQDVAKQSPGKFRRIASTVVRWLNRLVKKISGKQDFYTADLVTDVRKVRAALAEATAKYAENRINPEKSALFSEAFKDLKTFESPEQSATKAGKKTETTLSEILAQATKAPGIQGQLAKLLQSFIPNSKLDTKIIVNPAAQTASYMGGTSNIITLQNVDNIGTALHEIVHAVTVREMEANPKLKRQVTILMNRTKRAAIKNALVTPAQMKEIEQAKTSKEFKSKFSADMKYGNIAYAFLNEEEFLAQTFKSTQFQSLLKATKIRHGGKLKRAWDAFVETVMRGLGIKDVSGNAFGESLKLIAELAAQENVNLPSGGDGRNSPRVQPIVNSKSRDIETISNILNTESFTKKGLNGLDSRTRKSVQVIMGRLVGQQEVFDSVVKLVPVDVVNNLISGKLSSEELTHDESMLKSTFPINADRFIPPALNASPSVAVGVITRVAAIRANLTGGTSKDLSAAFADYLDSLVLAGDRTVKLSGLAFLDTIGVNRNFDSTGKALSGFHKSSSGKINLQDDYTKTSLKSQPNATKSNPDINEAYESTYDDDLHETVGSIVEKSTGRPDSSIMHTIFSTAEYIFHKFPATKKMFEAALNRRDVKYQLEAEILGDYTDEQGKEHGFVPYMKGLKKQHKKEYDRANQYILDVDKSGKGFNLRHGKGYAVYDKDGNVIDYRETRTAALKLAQTTAHAQGVESPSTLVSDEKIEHWYVVDNKGSKSATAFLNEKEAVDAMLSTEAKHMAKEGYSDIEVEAVLAFRSMTNRAFDKMVEDMRKVINEAEKAGYDPPTMEILDEGKRWVVLDKGKKIAFFHDKLEAQTAAGRKHTIMKQADGDIRKEVSISEAIAMMGDLRGSYMPRQRQRGAMVLRAEKGDDKILEKFDFYMAKKEYISPDGEVYERKMSNWLRNKVNRASGKLPFIDTLEKRARALKKQGYNVTISKDEAMPESVFDAAKLVVSTDALLVEAQQSAKKSDKEAMAEINKILTSQIADIIKSRGFLSSRMKRTDDYWRGFEEDMLLAGTQYARGLAAGFAKRDAAQKMVAAITGRDVLWSDWKLENPEGTWEEYDELVKSKRVDPKKQPNLHREAMGFLSEVLRNEEQADRVLGTLKGLAVIKFLGFRISSAAVNMTNMVQAVPATISSQGGGSITSALNQVRRAAGLYAKYRKPGTFGRLSEEDRRIFTEITNNGWDDAQFNAENAAVLQSKVGQRWNRFNEMAMYMFSAVEKANRSTTIFAAYKELKKKTDLSHAELMERAKHISDRAHGIYGKATMPAWTRGQANPLKLLYTFQKFSHNYLLNMAEMGIKGDTKEIGYMLISPAALAGAGASLLTPLIKALVPGEEDEERFYAWAEETFGSERFFRHGIAGLAGVNLKGSLQMNNPMPTSIKEVFGAPGAILFDTLKGMDHARKGEGLKAVEALLPTAFGNTFKAIREGNEGITTGSYSPVFYGNEPLKASTLDQIIRGLSFNPSGLSSIREKQWNEEKVSREFAKRKGEILSGFKQLIIFGKGDRHNLLKRVRRYNELVRATGRRDISPITGKSISISVKRAMRASKRERLRDRTGSIRQ